MAETFIPSQCLGTHLESRKTSISTKLARRGFSSSLPAPPKLKNEKELPIFTVAHHLLKIATPSVLRMKKKVPGPPPTAHRGKQPAAAASPQISGTYKFIVDEEAKTGTMATTQTAAARCPNSPGTCS